LQFESFAAHFTAIERLRSQFNKEHASASPFPILRWQKSFLDHIIRDENDHLNHLEYIYNNAIKHGLAKEPEKYPFMWISGMAVPYQPD
jgi:REP element-mobilizing transposase RayT